MAIAEVRDILKMLRRDGWWPERQEGTSHRQFRYSTKEATVTVNGHNGDTLPHWLVGSILKPSGTDQGGSEAMTEYLAIIEPAEDGSGFGAYVPDLPGCVATGRTREEAKERIAFSIPRHIA